MKKYKDIPQELKDLAQWVVWGKVAKNAPKKQPYNAKTDMPAKVDASSTWATFEDCMQAIKKCKYIGAGFVFNHGYIAIDLDNVIDSKGNVLTEAKEIIEMLDSYTEYSQSKKGFHIIVKGDMLLNKNRNAFDLDVARLHRYTRNVDGKKKEPEIEMYTGGRYFAITGNVYQDRKEIKPHVYQVRKAYERYIEKFEQKTPALFVDIKSIEPMTTKQQTLLEIMLKGENGGKIKALWEGNTSNYTSQSEADIALCNYLAFYTDNDPQMIFEMIKHSALFRDKWLREDYASMTIGKAVALYSDIPTLSKYIQSIERR